VRAGVFGLGDTELVPATAVAMAPDCKTNAGAYDRSILGG